MKLKLFSIFLVLCLILNSSATAAALDPIQRFTDRANLVPDSNDLEYRLSVISQKYQMEVAILTVDTLDGKSASSYADDYYDSQGYGWGTKNSGLLLLIAMDEREWAVSTCGDAIRAVTDDEIDDIISNIAGKLSAGAYYEAFDAFLDQIETEYQAFTVENTLDAGDIILRIVIALVIGAAIAGIALLIMRRKRTRQSSNPGQPLTWSIVPMIFTVVRIFSYTPKHQKHPKHRTIPVTAHTAAAPAAVMAAEVADFNIT